MKEQFVKMFEELSKLEAEEQKEFVEEGKEHFESIGRVLENLVEVVSPLFPLGEKFGNYLVNQYAKSYNKLKDVGFSDEQAFELLKIAIQSGFNNMKV